MIPKCSCYPVDGGLESGPQSKAQCFVGRFPQAAGRPDGLTGGVRQLEVSIDRLKASQTGSSCGQWVHGDLVSVSLWTVSEEKNTQSTT